MTKIDTSPEAIAALLEGVTPGPWEFDAPYIAAFQENLGEKLLALKAHGIIIASFPVSSF